MKGLSSAQLEMRTRIFCLAPASQCVNSPTEAARARALLTSREATNLRARRKLNVFDWPTTYACKTTEREWFRGTQREPPGSATAPVVSIARRKRTCPLLRAWMTLKGVRRIAWIAMRGDTILLEQTRSKRYGTTKRPFKGVY